MLLTGAELSLFTVGFLPGDRLSDRLALLTAPGRRRELIAQVPARINDFLAKAADVVGARFGGKLSYASLPFEGVDWAAFDVISTDAAIGRSSWPAGSATTSAPSWRRQWPRESPPRSPSSGVRPTAGLPTWAAVATRSSNGTTTAGRGACGPGTPVMRPSRPRMCGSCWRSSTPKVSTPRS